MSENRQGFCLLCVHETFLISRYGIVWKGLVNEQPVAVKIFSAIKKQYFLTEKDIYNQPFMDSCPALLTYFGTFSVLIKKLWINFIKFVRMWRAFDVRWQNGVHAGYVARRAGMSTGSFGSLITLNSFINRLFPGLLARALKQLSDLLSNGHLNC